MATNINCLPHQGRFLSSPMTFPEVRFFFEICGYGAGKTSSLVYMVLWLIKYYSGCKSKEGEKPKIAVCGITLSFLKKTFSGKLEEFLINSNTKYAYDKQNNIMKVAGVTVFMIPIQDEESIFGFDVSAAIVDELDELPTYAAKGVVKSLNDRCRQQIEGKRPPFLAFATTSQGLKGTFQIIEEFKRKSISYLIIRGTTASNIYHPKEYIQAMYALYTGDERACLLEGKFVDIDAGKVYPRYNPIINMASSDLFEDVRREPKYTVYIGQDFNSGFNKAVAIIMFGGKLYAVKEYDFPDPTDAPKVFRYDFPMNDIYWIPDMTYKEQFGQFKKGLRESNIKIVYRVKNPLVADRNFAVNSAFKMERLFICPICSNLDNSLMIHQIDKKTGKPMKGTSKDAPDHITDAFGYVTYWLFCNKVEFRDLYKMTIGRIKSHRGVSAEDDIDKYNIGEEDYA